MTGSRKTNEKLFDSAKNAKASIKKSNLEGSEHYFREGSGLDRLINIAKHVQEEDNVVVENSENMVGICLNKQTISYSRLSNRYGGDEAFLKFVTGIPTPQNPDQIAITQCSIHVHEITGILPQPNLIEIQRYTTLEKPTDKQVEDYFLHLTRLKRYPYVYGLDSALNGIPAVGTRLDVVFYDTTNFSFGGRIDVVGANSLTR